MKIAPFALSVFGYYFAIQFGALNYLYCQTFATGVFYELSYDFNWAAQIGLFIALTLNFLPTKIEKASEMFFFCLYVFVYIPAIAFIGAEVNPRYIPLAISFTLGIIVIGLTTRLSPVNCSSMSKVPKQIMDVMLTCFIVIFVILFFRYYSVLNISSLENVYQQREIGKADTWYLGYAQTYFVFFFSAFILSAGLFEKKNLLILLGSFGFLFMYTITAERTTVVTPVIIKLIHNNRYRLRCGLNLVALFLVLSSIVIVAVSLFYDSYPLINEIGFYFFTRPIATPGKFVLDYHDFFAANGLTYFSHIKGFNLIVPTPEVYKWNPYWPGLGWIVGNDFHRLDSNSNASFVSADGLASIGVGGAFLMCLVFSIFLLYLDKFSKKIPSGLVITSTFPIAFALTNGSLFTTLLSYGGFAVLILFYQISKAKPRE